MRGKNPDYIDASCREQARAAASKFQAERESYRAEAEADQQHLEALRAGLAEGRPVTAIHFDAPEAEVSALRAGLAIGARDERNRILAALDALERKAASLFFEGTPSQRAVAQYVAEVRRVVEGGKS